MMNSADSNEDGILSLLDVPRKSSRASRKKVKKKVTFANGVKNPSSSLSSSSGSLDENDKETKEIRDVEDKIKNDEVELKSFSKSSRPINSKIGSLSDLFSDDVQSAPSVKGAENGIKEGRSDQSLSSMKRRKWGDDKDSSSESRQRLSMESIEPSYDNIRNSPPSKNSLRVLKSDDTNYSGGSNGKSSNLLNHRQRAFPKAEETDLSSRTIDAVVDRLKTHLEDTQRMISKEMSDTFHTKLEKRGNQDVDMEEWLSRLNKIMVDYRAMLNEERTNSQQEESKLITLHERLETERHQMNEYFQQERHNIAEERIVIEKWRENAHNEIDLRQSQIEQKTQDLIHRENQIEILESKAKQREEKELMEFQYQKEKNDERSQSLIVMEAELKQQRKRIDLQYEDIEKERYRLREMAEQLSRMSFEITQKSDIADQSIQEARQMVKNTEIQSKDLKRRESLLQDQIATLKEEKMDLVRHRVEFLKYKHQSVVF